MMKKSKKKQAVPVMPEIFARDPVSVIALMEEARRLNEQAEKWKQSKPGNPLVVSEILNMACAMTLAGGWLRCKLAGEMEPEKTTYTRMQHVLGELAFRANNCPPLLDTPERVEAARYLRTAIREAEKLLVRS